MIHAAPTPQPPPRLLLGVALLVWGGFTGHPVPGLIAAFVVEAAHWSRIRWDFGDLACQRAWRLSLILVLMVGVVIWLSSSFYSTVPKTVAWLPLVLIPLQFIQSYGTRNSMSLASFSRLHRNRIALARKHGQPRRDIRFNFGSVYFAAIIVAASVGSGSKNDFFFPAIIILVLWYFYRSFSWRRPLAPIAAIVMTGFAALGAYVGERAMEYVYQRLWMGGEDYAALDYARQTRTAIGDLGEIKQSSAIQWRLMPGEGRLPRLLRIAAYNKYHNTYWRTALPTSDGDDIFTDQGMFEEPPSYGIDEQAYRVTARVGEDDFADGDVASRPGLNRFVLRGSFARKGLLPIPANTASLVQESQNLEINPFGTLRLDPKHPVANAEIRFGGELNTALPPWPDARSADRVPPDLNIPEEERAAVRKLVDELQLRELPLDEKIRVLRNHFTSNFEYTRYLDRRPIRGGRDRSAFVSIFLEDSRRGHCEYFATATAFLLRECGIPTRYATGFSVSERDTETGIAYIRGTHAHAWALAWDEAQNTWIDVDLTPPSWSLLETPAMPWWQRWSDRLAIIRDDFLVWRTQPGNMAFATVLMVVPVILGALYIGRRLWKSRRRLDPVVRPGAEMAVIAHTSLDELEKTTRSILGERPPGTPITRWLAKLADTLTNPAPLHQAIELHQQLRFDPTASASNLAPSLDSAVETVRLELRQRGQSRNSSN